MKRRHFLLNAASCLPCCLLPTNFVRRAAAALDAGDTVAGVAAPARAKTTLYAVNDCGNYKLSLDSTAIEPDPLSWRQWADIHGPDINKVDEFLDFAIDQGILEEGDTLDKLFKSPDEEIDGRTLDHYIEGTWAMSHSPQAQAFHYLQALDIGNARSSEGDCLGELEFFLGPCPGSNWTGVETYDELVLVCLQRRLLELGEDVRVVVV